MTVLEIAEKVLAEAGEPLHYREIAQRMISQGLWRPDGQRPWATVISVITVDIKERGGESSFRRVARGVYALNDQFPAGQPAPAPAQQPPKDAAKAMPFLDAAERILKQYGGGKPMHYRAVTKKALELGIIATTGQTPEATMYAQVFGEIQRKTKRGEQPRFALVGKGYVALTEWTADGLAGQIQQHNREVRGQLLQRLREMKPVEFEALIGRLLTAIGFDSVVVTPAGGDGGIDVRGTLVVGDVVRIQMAVQVKRWKHNVQAPTVQQVRGSLGAHEQGLIITTGDFSQGARVEAQHPHKAPVALMKGEQLVDLMVENDIGVRRARHDLIELGEEEES